MTAIENDKYSIRKPRISKGYRYVYAPQSHGASKSKSYNGYVLEHRFVMENYLGRALTKDEDVHHIDFNTLNNEISNLIVLSKKEHQKVHHAINGHIVRGEFSRVVPVENYVCDVEVRKCIDCGKQLSVYENSKSHIRFCVECSHKRMKKCQRPERDELEHDVLTCPYTTLEKKYRVSTGTIKKWLKEYSIDIPDRRLNWVSDKPFVMTEKRIIASRMNGEKARHRWEIEKCPYANEICQYTNDMNLVASYSSAADACRKNSGFRDSPIIRCCKGKLKTYKGFVWKYKDLT